MSLASVQMIIHSKILAYRRIENLSKLHGFEKLFDNHKDKLIPLMLDGDVDLLEIEIMKLNKAYTYHYLFELCKKHQVFKYSRLTKAEMLSELVKLKVIEVV